MLHYLAVLAVVAVMVACSTGDVLAVTDREFQAVQLQLQELSNLVRNLSSEMVDLKKEVRAALDPSGKDLVQNTTIEERVTLLELQMIDVHEDVSLLFENDDFLFDEQVIQDERLFSLEEENDQTDEELDQIENEIEGLQVATLELDFRVTELEENGGSDGNSSISELEVRVETLEGTAADHEARINTVEGNIEDLESRATAAEENIQGLQMTDISLDARITALEESGDGGGLQNETIAFHAVLTAYTSIPDESTVEFNEVVLNQGNGYDSTTGVFTVPSGGDGLYYFSTYLRVSGGEYGLFDIERNDDVICTAAGEHESSGQSDSTQATCSAVVSVVEGDEVKLVLWQSVDTTPLIATTAYYYNGFNGFRI